MRVEKRISFPEARKLVETGTPVVAGKSYAAAVNLPDVLLSILIVRGDMKKRTIANFLIFKEQ